ncbi:hypothetical protein [Helicobacter sp. T3_23-1056]
MFLKTDSKTLVMTMREWIATILAFFYKSLDSSNDGNAKTSNNGNAKSSNDKIKISCHIEWVFYEYFLAVFSGRIGVEWVFSGYF